MVYQNRYFIPFVGTTEAIGDKAVTGDKISNKAVGTGQLADEAVTGTKIKDDTIESKDIKDKTLQTEDYADKSVTAEKLADNAVTTYKIGYRSITGSKIALSTITEDLLAFTSVVRPLTPGIDTNEIQDGKVTHPKLAADAVETVNIKVANVTGAKIANDTITNANIAANAVEGLEIKDGAVSTSKLSTDAVETPKIKNLAVTQEKLAGLSVGTPQLIDGSVTTPKIENAAVTENKITNYHVTAIKLATDSVETLKIKDGSVTPAKLSFTPTTRPLVPGVDASEVADDAVETAKIKDLNVTADKLHDDALADRLIESLLSRRQIFYDDFVGSVLRGDWVASGDAGGSCPLSESRVQIKTNAAANAYWRISWGYVSGYWRRELPKMMVRLNPITTNIACLVGLYATVDVYIAFRLDTSISPNWFAVCRKAGVETAVDTGVAAVPTMTRLKIDVVSETEVRFYINDVLKATIATNITTGYVEPYLQVKTLTDTAKWMWVDKVLTIAEEWEGIPPP